MQLLGRHFDVAIGRRQAIGNIELFERADDFAARAIGQLRIQHAIRGRVQPQIGGGQRDQRQHQQQGKHETPQRTRFRDQIAQTVQPGRHCAYLVCVVEFSRAVSFWMG